ncbi:hypothetical protein RHMOL_Rhmol13G0236300 [Rhododendron molle]|uniref:Uncharacterized protein n=1 Tax=Rhododendron molle TaxID=49168 RepID=A0ACC0LAD1_RHOML|nr:hypothetical protein RHMOL_Rhmol13G0236300 [Rhododendron molle]
MREKNQFTFNSFQVPATTNCKTTTMALDQCFAHDWKSISATAAAAEPETEKISGGFDCNICLEFASDPVVTLCGHLYCWPCIYKWVNYQSSPFPSNDFPKCPVCKSEISHETVVPLYGHGHTHKEPQLEAKSPSPDVTIPPRPPACGAKALAITSPRHQQLPYQHYEEDISPPSPYSPSNSTEMGSFNPGVGMFGEMVYSRVFGNSESLYMYPNSYHISGSSSPRLRRQEIQADKSLNRVTIFLFFCFFVCLLLF